MLLTFDQNKCKTLGFVETFDSVHTLNIKKIEF